MSLFNEQVHPLAGFSSIWINLHENGMKTRNAPRAIYAPDAFSYFQRLFSAIFWVAIVCHHFSAVFAELPGAAQTSIF